MDKLLAFNRFLRCANSILMGINVIIVLLGWETSSTTLVIAGAFGFLMAYIAYQLTFRAEKNV